MSDHTYVLHARNESGGEIRHLIHLCEPEEERVDSVLQMLRIIDTPPLSMSHVRAVAGGTHHPVFPKVLQQLRMTWSKGCAESIVDRATEMLVAADLVPTACIDDHALWSALSIAFSTDEDWDDVPRSAQHCALAFLSHYGAINEDSDKHTTAECMAVTQLAAGICVAITQARAEWSRNARGGE